MKIMNNNIAKKNEKRKNTLCFFLFTLLGAFLGGILGFGSSLANFFLSETVEGLRLSVLKASPVLLVAVCILSLLLSLALLLQGKRIIRDWDNEDEAVYRRFELALGRSMAASSIGVILTLIFFGLAASACVQALIDAKLFLSCALILVLTNVLLPFIQRQCVEQLKNQNPEKKGDALELHFQKKWLESCDEQERMSSYRAAFKAFSLLSPVALVVFVILFLMVFQYKIGFLPFLIAGVMWLIPTCIYMHESLKEQHQEP